jgi:hypothetical protein
VGAKSGPFLSSGFTVRTQDGKSGANHRNPDGDAHVKPEELKKLDAYFKRTLNPNIIVKARPRKNDSAEVYIGEEFLGVIYRDDEDGDLSYNFSMAILDVDLT